MVVCGILYGIIVFFQFKCQAVKGYGHAAPAEKEIL